MYVSSQFGSLSFWLPGMVLIFANITHGLPDHRVRPAFTSVAEMPLFFGTAIFAFEGISLVSGLWLLIFHWCLVSADLPLVSGQCWSSTGVWSVLIFHSGVWSVLIFHSGVWSVLIFHSGVWSVLIFHWCLVSADLPLVSGQCWSSTGVWSVLIFHWCLISADLPLVSGQCWSSNLVSGQCWSGVWPVLIFHWCLASADLPLVPDQCWSSTGVWSVLIFHWCLVSADLPLWCLVSADHSSVQAMLIFEWWLVGRLTNWLCAWWILTDWWNNSLM